MENTGALMLPMNVYKHTQPGKLIIVAMSIAALITLLLGFTVARPILSVIPVLVLSGWLFHSLTIEVADGQLRWRFGPGLIWKSVLLSEVVSAKCVRITWLEGWGIHLSRFGWLYNVSGFDAVAITLRNGKRFALGTDEPEVLANVLRPGATPHVRRGSAAMGSVGPGCDLGPGES